MYRIRIPAIGFPLIFASVIMAQAQDFMLSTALGLQDNGFMQFIMPRFSLKTRIKPRLETNATKAEAF